MSDYFKTVLHENPKKVFLTFSIISITGPTLGVVFGGIIAQLMGGYDNPRTLKLMILLSMLGSGAACPVPFLNSFWMCSLLIWLLLFFGGAMVPALTGIMLNSVKP